MTAKINNNEYLISKDTYGKQCSINYNVSMVPTY